MTTYNFKIIINTIHLKFKPIIIIIIITTIVFSLMLVLKVFSLYNIKLSSDKIPDIIPY